mmetsp:Transcript_35763/g.101216  ORF Transcript_35763/g.101216 Transcript_35763/m.101216 type:complete len:250 (+) Transcript_35763:183-932(+)
MLRTLALLAPLLGFWPGNLVRCLDLDNRPPATFLDMECWEDVLCHVDHLENMTRVMIAEARTALENPNIAESAVLVECTRCPGSFNNTVCYRRATSLNHEFSQSLLKLGHAEFGKDPSGCGGNTTYCYSNVTCNEKNTVALESELSNNLYASPLLSIECEECNSDNATISCFMASCVSCFYSNNNLRFRWEGLHAFGLAANESLSASSCEEVEELIADPSISVASQATLSGMVGYWLVFAAFLSQRCTA